MEQASRFNRHTNEAQECRRPRRPSHRRRSTMSCVAWWMLLLVQNEANRGSNQRFYRAMSIHSACNGSSDRIDLVRAGGHRWTRRIHGVGWDGTINCFHETACRGGSFFFRWKNSNRSVYGWDGWNFTYGQQKAVSLPGFGEAFRISLISSFAGVWCRRLSRQEKDGDDHRHQCQQQQDVVTIQLNGDERFIWAETKSLSPMFELKGWFGKKEWWNWYGIRLTFPQNEKHYKQSRSHKWKTCTAQFLWLWQVWECD